jgi:hypothetical protein
MAGVLIGGQVYQSQSSTPWPKGHVSDRILCQRSEEPSLSPGAATTQENTGPVADEHLRRVDTRVCVGPGHYVSHTPNCL